MASTDRRIPPNPPAHLDTNPKPDTNSHTNEDSHAHPHESAANEHTNTDKHPNPNCDSTTPDEHTNTDTDSNRGGQSYASINPNTDASFSPALSEPKRHLSGLAARRDSPGVQAGQRLPCRRRRQRQRIQRGSERRRTARSGVPTWSGEHLAAQGVLLRQVLVLRATVR